jgi:hypothetical protein
MPPTLAVQFSAAADGRQVTADVDTVLTGVHPSLSSVRVVVSRDKTTTIANAITAPANVTDENIIAIAGGFPVIPLSVPVSAGQSVFVSCSAAGSAVLSWEDLGEVGLPR